MKQSTRARITGTAVVVTVLAVVILAVVFALAGPLAQDGDDAPGATPTPTTAASPTSTPSPSPTPSPTPQTYYIEERPDYYETMEYLTDLFTEHQAAYEDNSFLHHVPTSTEGREYAWDLLYLLDEPRDDLRMARGTTSTDTDELDAQIAAFRQEADDLVQRFENSEDFDTSIEVPREDGSWYESDGAAPSGDPEEWARDYQAEADANGSYVTASEEVAAEFGLSLTTDWSAFDDDGACAAHQFDFADVAAYYCGATPEVIYINDDHQQFPAMYHDAYFFNLVLHELAHHQMGVICTDNPPIAGDLLEGVTNSYAVLYLGASRSELARMDDPEYQTTDETDDIARQIREEYRCE